MKTLVVNLCVLLLAGEVFGAGSVPRIVLTTNAAPAGFIEGRAVEAGAFNPGLWESGKLNFVPDLRFTLLSTKPGKFRNI